MSENNSKNISEKLGLTPDIISGGTIIRIYGHDSVIVENCKSIIEYNDKSIRLQCKKERVTIAGQCLSIAFYNYSDIRIDGIISNITIGWLLL